MSPPHEPVPIPVTLGSHCALPTCNSLDFLPIPCPHCTLTFCRHHAPPSTHQCAHDPGCTLVTDGARFKDKFDDLLPDPKRRALDRTEADRVNGEKTAAAKAVLEKNFGAEAVKKMGAGTASASEEKKAVKVNPILALMKLKQRSKPANAKAKELAMDERIYVTVALLDGEERAEMGARELYLAKTTSCGKALDLFATAFGLTNVNNTSSDPAKLLVLATSSEPPTIPSTSEKISSLVTNGGSVLLFRGGKLAAT